MDPKEANKLLERAVFLANIYFLEKRGLVDLPVFHPPDNNFRNIC